VRFPLLFLFLRTRRNALIRFLTGLRRPKRLVGAVLTLLVVAFPLAAYSVAPGLQAQGSSADPSAFLVTILAVTLVLSVFGGLTERGIAFSPSDVDFLFAGPFHPRSLVLYHVACLYPPILLVSGFLFVLFGQGIGVGGLVFAAIVLCELTAANLRLIVSVLAVQIGERVFRRLRGPVRFVVLLTTVALVVAIASVFTRGGGIRPALASITSSPVARAVFYPAAAVGDVARATNAEAALPALLGGFGAWLGSLFVLLALQVNFLEASLAASERLATRKSRLRSGKVPAAVVAMERPATRVRLPALRVFQGAGAVAWKNLVVARRSGRTLLFSLAFAAILVVPATVSDRAGGYAALVTTALFPFLLSSAFAFDFRGESTQVPRLKALPVTATGLAAAEIAVPTFLSLGVQAVLLVIFAALRRVDVLAIVPALIAYLPITAGFVALANLAHFLSPKGSPLGSILQILFLFGDVILVGGAGWLLNAFGVPLWILILVLFALQTAVVGGVLALLGSAFSEHDPATETL
jgi:hypothetical protein